MILRLTLSLVAVLSGSVAQAWGPAGHEIVSSVGASVTRGQGSEFWIANADGMKTLSTVPDRVWKQPATKEDEAPTHWFQADAYVPDLNQCADLLAFPRDYDEAVSKYGEAKILKNGTAPWRILQFYKMAISSFKQGNFKAGLEQAGAMSHYIADLSMPLHVSENYDGQMTGNRGLHAWFETKNIPDKSTTYDDVTDKAQALLTDHNFKTEVAGDLESVIMREVIRSLLKRDEVLKNDSKYGRDSKEARSRQLELAEDQMADGAATLSVILDRLFAEAGVRINSSVVPIDDPSWTRPVYSGLRTEAREYRGELHEHSDQHSEEHSEDGCYRQAI